LVIEKDYDFNKLKELFYSSQFRECVLYADEFIHYKDANDSNVHYYRARALAICGDSEESISYCESIKLNKNNIFAYVYKAILLLNIGYFNEDHNVMDLFFKALTIELELYSNDLSNYYVVQGLAYEGLNFYNRADTNYLKAISLDSNNLYAYLSKDRLYQFLERNDDAIVMFLKAIDINSKFSISYYNKAQCLEECGMIASAQIYINYYTHLCSVNRTLINI
jgi:tetratricopeptide (TPR) repeat protein